MLLSAVTLAFVLAAIVAVAMSIRSLFSFSGTTRLRDATGSSVDVQHDRADEFLKYKGADGTMRTVVTTTGTQTLTNKTMTAPNIGAGTGTSLQVTSFIKSSGPGATAGIGYSTGAGGAVTQITSRVTGVTVTGLSGTIQTDVTSLAAEAAAEFTVTNTSVEIGDVVVVAQRSGAVGAMTDVIVSAVAAGSFKIKVINNNPSAGVAETGAIILNFIVFKAVAA